MSDKSNVNDAVNPVQDAGSSNGFDLTSLATSLADMRSAQVAMESGTQRQPTSGQTERPAADNRATAEAQDRAARRAAEIKAEENLPADVKKERATLRAMGPELDKTGKLDMKVLAEIINKNIKDSTEPRKKANEVLGFISRWSDKYQLSIQGMGNNMMIYRAALVGNAQSDLLPLPGVSINDRPTRIPKRGTRN